MSPIYKWFFLICGSKNKYFYFTDSFDREYMESLEKLTPGERDSKMYLRCDNPNLNKLTYFKHYFRELDLL